MLWCFMYIKGKDIKRKYKEAYELRRERNPKKTINIGAKVLSNQKNYILKAERVSTAGIDEIKKNIRLKIWNDREDHTKGMNGDKMNMNDKEHQKRDQECNNTLLGKIENNKHSGAEGERYTVRNDNNVA